MSMGSSNDRIFNAELQNARSEVEEEVAVYNIQEAVKILLQGLGEDTNREGLIETPLRAAKAMLRGTRGYKQKVKDILQGALFPEAGLDDGYSQGGGAGGLVVVRDLDLFSYCESCLLPFRIKCHIGYVPSRQRVVGLSKLSRIADVFAKRLQDPQRLADEICVSLQNEIRPAGVGVVLQCWHIQFPQVVSHCSDQINHPCKVEMHGWSKLTVCAGSGILEDETSDAWCDFSSFLTLRGVKVDKVTQLWCPSTSLDGMAFKGNKNASNPEPPLDFMIAAVTKILLAMGEDPLRKELVGTPQRFVQWLMNFSSSNMKINLNGQIRSHKNKEGDQDEARSELNLPVWTQCEHHLLPFYGVVHIGYSQTKGTGPIERSILQSIVHFYGSRLQVQERVSKQIMETVCQVFGCDVMVVVEANHICMISRGVEKVRSSTATIATTGRFSTDSSVRDMFLQTVSDSTAFRGNSL